MATTMNYTTLIPLLKTAPDGQLADAIKPLLDALSDPPTALHVLNVLDQCVYVGGASSTVMALLTGMLEDRIKAESTTYERVAASAGWRNDDRTDQ